MPLLAWLVLIRGSRRCLRPGAVAAVLLLTGCFIIATNTEVRPIPVGEPIPVAAPIKVHLRDGSVVLFRDGSTVSGDSIVGRGVRFDLSLRDSTDVRGVAVATVAGVEAFVKHTDPVGTFLLSLVGSGVAVVAALGLYVAVFGSCPTIYSDSAGTAVLEAEGFSYSIAPLFEARDVDRLRALPDSLGRLVLEIRNEAAETHFVNQLEVLDVEKLPEELVVPDDRDHPLAVAGLTRAAAITDAAHHDHGPELAAADGRLFASDPDVVAAADLAHRFDTLFVTLPPFGSDSAALVLRLRNSLLTTVLLYDVMLRNQGARALDWMGTGLADLGTVTELGRWYRSELGLRIEVSHDGEWRPAGWIRDVGPIAFEEIGVVIPTDHGGPTKVRLVFPIDGWRIDRLAVAPTIRRPRATRVGIASIADRDGRPIPDAAVVLRDPDSKYLETQPGQLFTARFDLGPRAPDRRAVLLVTQGYYTEWMRPEWLTPRGSRPGFAPDSSSVADALARWRLVRDSLELAFNTTRIPVR